MVKTKVSKKSKSILFRGIAKLSTFRGFAEKEGRRALAGDTEFIARGAFLVREGRIVWVGPEAKLPKSTEVRGAREVNLKANAVMPAFVESHTHLMFAGHRAAEFERRNQGESYQAIAVSGGGILSTVRATREATEKTLQTLAQVRVDRFIQQGATTVEVKSGYSLDVDGECKMLKAAGKLKRARIVRTFLGAHAVPKESKDAEDYVDILIREAFPRVQREKLATRADIFIENGYFSAELARRYFQAACRHGLATVAHAEQLTHSGGTSLAIEMGSQSADHLIRITPEDIRRLAASEVTCGLLPSADLYMKCPYPPARALIDSGARVALATDFNPGTSPSQDLALVGLLARLEMKMSLPEILSAYTVGGAYALGLGRELGALIPGRFADFIVLESDLDELFFEVGRQPIRSVYREAVKLV